MIRLVIVRVTLLVGLVVAAGCGLIPEGKPAALVPVQSRAGSRPKPSPAARRGERAAADDAATAAAARTSGNWLSRSEWWARTKRQLAQMQREIRADLDMHETEGLEAFGPDAVDQVKSMRSEMSGSGLIGP